MINIHIILYSNNCPQCKILKSKLDDNKIEYELCSDTDLMLSKGFKSVPMLEVDNIVMTFSQSLNWLKERDTLCK